MELYAQRPPIPCWAVCELGLMWTHTRTLAGIGISPSYKTTNESIFFLWKWARHLIHRIQLGCAGGGRSVNGVAVYGDVGLAMLSRQCH